MAGLDLHAAARAAEGAGERWMLVAEAARAAAASGSDTREKQLVAALESALT